jgi:hypothetical protein
MFPLGAIWSKIPLRRINIVATLGPASTGRVTLERLISAGLNAARLKRMCSMKSAATLRTEESR